MSNQQEFAKWQSQIELLVNHFELDVINNNRIFDRYRELVLSNDTINFPNGSQFHLWVERNHNYALLAALRKIFFATKDKNEVSMSKIIVGLKNSGNAVTRQNYPEHIGIVEVNDLVQSLVDSACRNFFDLNGKLAIDRLNKDLAVLKNACRRLAFINERVLHIQKKSEALTPSDEDLKKLIDELEKMLLRYRLFLSGHHTDLSPEDSSWIGIFNKRWVAED